MRVIGDPAPAIRDALLSAVDGALSGGAAEPTWLAIDNGDPDWVSALAAVPAEEKSRAVAAVGNEESLVKALHLGVGGAVWLPASSLGVLEALEAAASFEKNGPGCDPGLIQMLEGERVLTLVSISDCRFWVQQLGFPALEEMLASLALDLGAAPAILTWPALLVAGRVGSDEIGSHWQTVVNQGGRAIPGLSVKTIDSGAEGVVAASLSTLLRGESDEAVPGTRGVLPVHELPGGRRVGSWRADGGKAADSGWTAQPQLPGGLNGRWVFTGEEETVIEEVLSTDDVEALDDPRAIRVPGWACRELRSGTPSGLLVTRLAEAAERRDLPLWIPNLERDGLHFALCLPGTLWVDGPAVPR